MESRQVVGLVGAIALMIGVFAPHLIIGERSLNLIGAYGWEGEVLLITALATFFLLFKKQYRWLWVVTGISALAVVASFIRIQIGMAEVKSLLSPEVAKLVEGSFRTEYGWGWALLIAGVALLAWASAQRVKQWTG